MLSSEVAVCGRCGHHFYAAPPVMPPPPPLVDVPYKLDDPLSASTPPRQKAVAIALALGLGGIGVHGFYLGNSNMGLTLALMFVGGGAAGVIALLAAAAGACSPWLSAVGFVPLLIAATIPLVQAARYGAASAETFHQRYVVEKRWI